MTRPRIFDYSCPVVFCRDMISWRKENDPGFSVRRQARGCRTSASLVSHIVQGRRRITEDRLADLARILGLSEAERRCFKVLCGFQEQRSEMHDVPRRVEREPMRRGLFHPWYHLYLWESVRARGFAFDEARIFRMLGGVLSVPQIARGMRFLLREGFLRRNLHGEIVQDKEAVESTDEIASAEIRTLHRNALRVAMHGLESVPMAMREADMVLLTLEPGAVEELKALCKEFSERVMEFAERHVNDRGVTYQVIVHATPVATPVP